MFCTWVSYIERFPARAYMFKMNTGNTKTMSKFCSKLIMKIQE